MKILLDFADFHKIFRIDLVETNNSGEFFGIFLKLQITKILTNNYPQNNLLLEAKLWLNFNTLLKELCCN